jgi:hypothetical protein
VCTFFLVVFFGHSFQWMLARRARMNKQLNIVVVKLLAKIIAAGSA